jgi:hypothetical protein
MLRARSGAPFEPALLAELDRAIGEIGLRSISYEDPARGIAKRIWIDAEGRIAGVRLAGETGAAAWLKEQMQNRALVPPALALAPRPPCRAAGSCATVSTSPKPTSVRRSGAARIYQRCSARSSAGLIAGRAFRNCDGYVRVGARCRQRRKNGSRSSSRTWCRDRHPFSYSIFSQFWRWTTVFDVSRP